DLTLVLADIDYFKQVNDKFGHQMGDEALVQFANILGNLTRTEDLLARLGGEEFVLVLVHSDLAKSMEKIEKIRQSVEQHEIRYLNQIAKITCSFGLYQINLEQDTVKEAIRKADQALYLAKRSGRNCIKPYQQDPSPPISIVGG
ncbi:MAG: GGDEF domain-containing protein, partial [Kangiellaceae bacterium]|nr:GGDEF domain-containing protein [Kangiellaceae bacterium]